MKRDELETAVAEFAWSVEELFDRDWQYTEHMFPAIGDGGTFLDPNLDDEAEDWGNRAIFLERFRKLRRVMQELEIEPIPFSPQPPDESP
ncbi:MAG: hypothetical protein N2C14_02765 [Planctomycetales bacterium]